MSSDPLFGWDLTYKTVEKDIKQKSDVIVAFIHWNLMKRGFRSIGIGDEVIALSFLILIVLTAREFIFRSSETKNVKIITNDKKKYFAILHLGHRD